MHSRPSKRKNHSHVPPFPAPTFFPLETRSYCVAVAGTQNVDQAGSELTAPLAPASQLLRLKARSTTPGTLKKMSIICFYGPAAFPHVYVYIMRFLLWFKSGMSPKG